MARLAPLGENRAFHTTPRYGEDDWVEGVDSMVLLLVLCVLRCAGKPNAVQIYRGWDGIGNTFFSLPASQAAATRAALQRGNELLLSNHQGRQLWRELGGRRGDPDPACGRVHSGAELPFSIF